MRIVRFHLEPWQRCGSVTPSPAPSPSIAILSPHILRRQRPPSVEDFPSLEENTETLRLKLIKNKKRKMQNRYPQIVKKLSMLCSDVMARLVRRYSIYTIKKKLLLSNTCLLIKCLSFHFSLKLLLCNLERGI